jgi:hypothetical protein
MTGSDWWDRVVSGFTAAAPPVVPLWELLAVLAVAVGLSLPTLTWRYFGLFTTVVHELGHAFGNPYILFRRTMIPSPVWLLLFGAVIGYSWISAYGSFGHLTTRAFG